MCKAILNSFDPQIVAHPDDLSGISRLRKIPGFEKFLKVSIVKFQELISNVVYTGNGFEINDKTYKEISDCLLENCKILLDIK